MSSAIMSRPVDLAHLARYTGGDAKLNAEVLGLFVSQTQELLQRLASALASRNLQDWRYISHSLKGAARGVGAFPFGETAAAAEQLDPLMQPERAAEILKAMQNSSRNVHLFVDAYLGL